MLTDIEHMNLNRQVGYMQSAPKQQETGVAHPKGGLRNQYQGWKHILVLAMSIGWMFAKCMQHDSCDTGPGHIKIVLVLSFNFVKFQIDSVKHLQVTVCRKNFKMAAIMLFQTIPTSKVTLPRWCPIVLLSFKLIVRSVFELEFGNGISRWRLSCFSQWH